MPLGLNNQGAFFVYYFLKGFLLKKKIDQR